jgi:hypothetical protein
MRKPQPQASLWPDVNTPPETPLAILDDTSGARYSLHSIMECGAEFTYAQLVPFGCTDTRAERKVIELKRLKVA